MRQDLAMSFQPILKYSDNAIQILTIYSQTENLVIAVLYRQPDQQISRSTAVHFKKAIDLLKSAIDEIPNEIPDVILAEISTYHMLNGQNANLYLVQLKTKTL